MDLLSNSQNWLCPFLDLKKLPVEGLASVPSMSTIRESVSRTLLGSRALLT